MGALQPVHIIVLLVVLALALGAVWVVVRVARHAWRKDDR